MRVLSWIFDASGAFSWIWTFFVDRRKSEGFVVDFRRRWGFFGGFGLFSWIHEEVRVLSWISDAGGVFLVDLDFFRGSTKK